MEILVLLAVLGVVGALGAVGLVQAREWARRSQCTGNLVRLGVALQSYHQAHGMLPPAAIREGTHTEIVLRNKTSAGEPYTIRRTYANWTILLLPHLGQDPLAASFDLSAPVTDPANAAARER